VYNTAVINIIMQFGLRPLEIISSIFQQTVAMQRRDRAILVMLLSVFLWSVTRVYCDKTA